MVEFLRSYNTPTSISAGDLIILEVLHLSGCVSLECERLKTFLKGSPKLLSVDLQGLSRITSYAEIFSE
jgi:hypothetical protein